MLKLQDSNYCKAINMNNNRRHIKPAPMGQAQQNSFYRGVPPTTTGGLPPPGMDLIPNMQQHHRFPSTETQQNTGMQPSCGVSFSTKMHQNLQNHQLSMTNREIMPFQPQGLRQNTTYNGTHQNTTLSPHSDILFPTGMRQNQGTQPQYPVRTPMQQQSLGNDPWGQPIYGIPKNPFLGTQIQHDVQQNMYEHNNNHKSLGTVVLESKQMLDGKNLLNK